jgi:hypothetical protein
MGHLRYFYPSKRFVSVSEEDAYLGTRSCRYSTGPNLARFYKQQKRGYITLSTRSVLQHVGGLGLNPHETHY